MCPRSMPLTPCGCAISFSAMAANMGRVIRPQLVMAVSLPVVGFQFLSTLQASSSVKVHPRELDIYKEPEDEKYEVVESKPTPLEENVSKVRKVVWRYTDGVKDTTGKVKNKFHRVEDNAFAFVDLIQRDRTFQMKVGVISVSIVAGAVLAGRGRRPYRRVFFAAGLGTIAASICYPKKAVDITLTNFKKMKDFVNEQRVKYKQSDSLAESDKKPAEPAETKEASETTHKRVVSTGTLNEVEEDKDKVIKMEIKQEAEDVEVKGDSGMSNPEDKDLYSTRS